MADVSADGVPATANHDLSVAISGARIISGFDAPPEKHYFIFSKTFNHVYNVCEEQS